MEYQYHVFAPYRVCPLGAHVDHQHGLVTGFAIDKGVDFWFNVREDGHVHLESRTFEGIVDFDLTTPSQVREHHWGDYARGAKYALKKQQPKMVLLETNNLFRFQSDCRKRDSDLAEMSYQVFPFLKHHNFWNNKVNYLCNKGRHAYKGFGVSGKVKSYNGKIEGSIVTGNQITGESIKCLEKIREACDQAGARLVLYSAPSPKCYPEKKLAYLKKFAKEQGLTYYDLNKESKLMGIDWNVDTRDSGDHLNTAGAVKTTKYVGKLLEENYDLPDHSKDPEIASSWNKTPVIVNDEI